MLPPSYQLPAAIVLVLGGLLACFLGYRLFRIVLAIYGFILGALFGSSLAAATNTAMLVAAAVVGGIVGAIVLLFAYFVGVALIGAGLGALVVNLVWTQVGGDPSPLVVILVAVLGAISALAFQRYVIIIGTSFGGAWTTIVGALAAMGDRSARAAARAGDVWVVSPFAPDASPQWILGVWLALGAIGTIAQLGFTGKEKKKKR
ncbi:MAG: DUF4203 domain-containing protein [Acidobacteria bacterium]|nr:DUF4203 domain-containing protein [Acidobacteriota bacterium]MBI3262372.1 DUF4203 domain-containing protein [Acidobacteriota bacterium]